MNVLGRRRSLASVVVGATCILSTALWAGGAGFGDDDDNSEEEGPSYFGFVKDTRGAVISQAKVTAQIKNRGVLITHTNILGAYKISTFGKEVKPDEIAISCSKDGYKQIRVVERPASGGESGVEIECTLQRL